MRNALIANVLGGLSGDLAAALADRMIVWGRADADSEAERYFDLAVRAWNYDGIGGDYNGYDRDPDRQFATNQEWAMFYLGRALFYAQIVSDPYYTIPYYQPKRETFVETTRTVVRQAATRGIAVWLERKLPYAIGGGPAVALEIFLTTVEIQDLLEQVEDTWDVYQEHRPAFAQFVEGGYYDYVVPENLRQLGSEVERAGYPFRHENDLVVHSLLDYLPPQDRSIDPETIDLLKLVPDSFASLVPDDGSPSAVVREVGRRSHQYVHSGGFGRADRRIPEVHVLLESPYTLREIYHVDNLSHPENEYPDTGDVVRITLLDGNRIDGQVIDPPFPTPWQDAPYHNTSINMYRLDWADHYVSFTTIELEELRDPDNEDAPLPYKMAAILQRQHSNTLLYFAPDIYAAFPDTLHEDFYNPLDGRGFAGPVYRFLLPPLVGLDGSKGQHDDYDERDGAAKIAFDHLMLGADASVRLLRMFAHQAQTYAPPLVPVLGPDDLIIVSASPIQVHLYDRQDRHVGPNAAGSFDLEITGAQVFDNDITHQHFIVIPNLGPAAGSQVVITGTGGGTFDLDLYYTDDQDRAVHHVTYEAIPVQVTHQGRLIVQRGRSPMLDIDTNGDGVYEQSLSPTHERALPIFHYRSQAPWLSLALLMVTGVLGVVILVLLARRHRRLVPLPIGPSIALVLPICPNCGTVAQRPEAQFCSRCGETLASVALALPVCSRCGAAARRPDARFCPRCGGPV